MEDRECRPYARSMEPRHDDLHTDLLADIDTWLVAARALSATLAANTEQIERGRAMLAEGSRLTDAIATMSTTTRYLRMNKVLADFDVARFALRSSLISTALEEGLTQVQLVELLGVPAELTAQVLGELGRERDA
jgi:hypothetical protein